MKKAFIWLLVIVLIIVGSVWGTLAYLTDKETKTNTMTIGNVDIELLEYERTALESKNEDAAVQTFTQGKTLYPAVTGDDFDYSKYNAFVDWEQIGKSEYQSNIWDPAKINNELDKMVFVKNTGDNSTYVRVFFAFEAGAYTNLNQFNEKVHLNLNTTDWTWKWEPYIAKIGNEKFFIATATYKYPLEAGDFTKISLSQISLDPTAKNADVKAFNGEYNVPIFAQAIQTASFSDPVTALTTGFGNDIPFKGIIFDKGVTLKTALTYLEGNTAGTNIYNNVENIIFGTKDAYPEVKSSHSGTLTLNDLGAPTHTYYVPSKTTEGNYDLYILADEGKVYAPESSQNLFSGMASLIRVDARYLDVSNVKSMHSMFKNNGALTELDVTGWDVRSATSFGAMFEGCGMLTELAVNTWKNVNKVQELNYTFKNCKSLTYLDLSNWSVNKVNGAAEMFRDCSSLVEVKTPESGWDFNSDYNTANVKLNSMFKNCPSLTTLDVSKWNVGRVTHASNMFEGCSSLVELSVSNWRLGNVTTMASMFLNCKALKTLDVSDWGVTAANQSLQQTFDQCNSLEELELSAWDVSGVKSMSWAFRFCKSLTNLNVSGWNVANVTTFTNTFDGCISLTTIPVDTWTWGDEVNNATDMRWTFQNCSSLTSLDLSKWEVGGVTDMTNMFQGCSSLTSLDLSAWKFSKLKSINNMFQKCSSLESLNISNWNVSTVTAMSYAFNECNSLTVIDLSGWDTSNAIYMNYMFSMTAQTTKLQRIYVGDNWKLDNLINGGSMFLGCSNLVGGTSGKTYKSSEIDSTYANYITGYLTQGPAPANP